MSIDPCICGKGPRATYAFLGKDGRPLFFRCRLCRYKGPLASGSLWVDWPLSDDLPTASAADDEKMLIVSASQIKTWKQCHRKWFFEKIKKLPRPGNKVQEFGTVFHSVTERYRKATDTGRDRETKKPVELYPEKWAGSLSLFDQGIIKTLIEEGQENGTLRRLPGRRLVEEGFFRSLVTTEARDRVIIAVVGYIDCLYPEKLIVEDDKTTSSMRWALSSKKLAEDTQMLLYGWELLNRISHSAPDVVLRHNVFCKGKMGRDGEWKEEPRAVEREAKVSSLSCVQEVRKIQQESMRMLSTRQDAWEDISLDENEPRSCEKFGGCPFASICSQREPLEVYRKRLEAVKKDFRVPSPSHTTIKKEGDTMSSPMQKKLERLRQMKARARGTTAAPSKKEEHQAPSGAPPWTVEGCNACSESKHPGFNSRMAPCRICVNKSQFQAKLLHVTLASAPGMVSWHSDYGTGQYSFALKKETVAEKRAEEPAPKNKVEAFSADDFAEGLGEIVVETIKTPEEVVAAPKKKRGRPRKTKKAPTEGFTLLINCVSLGGDVVLLANTIHAIGQEIAKSKGVESRYELDAFKVRDMLCAAIQREDFSGKVVVGNTNTPDEKAVISALQPLADSTIVARA